MVAMCTEQSRDAKRAYVKNGERVAVTHRSLPVPRNLFELRESSGKGKSGARGGIGHQEQSLMILKAFI